MTSGIGGGMDPNALQRKALEAAEQTGRDGAGAAATPDAADSDVARFQAALNPQDAEPTAETPQSVNPPAGPSEMSAGDRILQGLQSASDKIQAGRNEAVEVLAKNDATQADLLRANFAMMESSTAVSAISKTTEKITQSIKTLQQG